jgi:DNA helicase-2/ATP-dependent DNA helicase PcrA
LKDRANTPWTKDVRGSQVLPLINDDPPTLRVPAGPGTGKTFGLRKRVLRLLHPEGLGLSPDRVLVCAFNRVIRDDLRAAIDAELEPYGIESPAVMTIHGLAAELAGRGSRFLLPQEVEAMMYDVREAHPNIAARYANRHSQLMRALREHEAGLGVHTAVATAVQGWLTAHGAALVSALPRVVETRIRGGAFAAIRFDHVIIDEFQDLTETEARLALALRANGGRVVALGDKKQSIYAFRGNEGQGLDALPEYVEGEVIDLVMSECQRCPNEIVDLSNEVMAIYDEPLDPVRGPGGQIHQVVCGTPGGEHRRMAQEIVRVYRERREAEHLVLVTRRKWGYDLRNAIREVDGSLHARTVFSEDILETWPAREAFLLLSIIGDPRDAVTLRDWISYCEPDPEGKKWKAAQRNAGAYAGLRATHGVLSLENALGIAELEMRQLSGAGRGNVIKRARRLKALLGECPKTEDPRAVVGYVLDSPRWVTSEAAAGGLAAEDIMRLRREVERILDDGREQLTLKDVVERLRYRIATREPLGEDEEPGIKIVTLWGAKGLTADHVYVVGLCDEAVPGPFDPDLTGLTPEEHELEQLRLLYVSLTRAKTSLVISRPRKVRRGEVLALGLDRRSAGNQHWQDLSQSRFVSLVSRGVIPDAVDGDSWRGITPSYHAPGAA